MARGEEILDGGGGRGKGEEETLLVTVMIAKVIIRWPRRVTHAN